MSREALLTRQEVADRLKVSYRTIINLVARGELRETRLASGAGDRSIPRYTEAAVQAYQAAGFNPRPTPLRLRAIQRGVSGTSPAH